MYYTKEVNAAGEYVLEGGTNSFVLRYDITNPALDTFANWVPVSESPFYFAIEDFETIEQSLLEPLGFLNLTTGLDARFNNLLMNKGGTLVGQSVFQLVRFRSVMKDTTEGSVEEVDLSFAPAAFFTNTNRLPTDPEMLRQEYETIATKLAEVFADFDELVQGNAVIGSTYRDDIRWRPYRKSTSDSIASGAVNTFINNEIRPNLGAGKQGTFIGDNTCP